MEFRILGPLEVAHEGQLLPLGGTKQRALLALLLLRPNEPVSVDRIVDELWGERAPPTAAKNVQVYVSHLRKALGEGVVVTRPPGYALTVPDGALDAQQAEEALTLAQGKPAAERVEHLRAGLGLWRGPPLAELADLPFADAEIGRLEELRLALLKRRIDAELELGLHAEVVAELEKLVATHPLDEHVRGQLMLALYQSGRQADALAVFRDARRALTEELGLEPDEELKSLERRILAHDPALRPPPRTLVPGKDASGERRERGGRRLRRSSYVGIGLVAAAAILAAVLGSAGDDPPPKLVVPANSVAVLDPGTGDVVAAIPGGRGPESVVTGARAVWVANVEDHTLSRIDPNSLQVTKTVGLGFEPTDLAADAQHVWVAGGYDHVLWRLDADGVSRLKIRFVERVTPLPAGFERGRAGVALGGGSVWLSHGDEVTAFDPATGALRRTVAAGGRWHSEIAVAGEWVWVGVNDALRPGAGTGLARFHVSEDRDVEVASLISDASEILLASNRLWVGVRFANAVWELNPETGLLQRTIFAGHIPEGVAFYDESLWITNERDATVRRVDARSGDTELVTQIGHILEEVTVANGRLFVAVRGT
jgi:DNA-binding SARP family transcriptional activator